MTSCCCYCSIFRACSVVLNVSSYQPSLACQLFAVVVDIFAAVSIVEYVIVTNQCTSRPSIFRSTRQKLGSLWPLSSPTKSVLCMPHPTARRH